MKTRVLTALTAAVLVGGSVEFAVAKPIPRTYRSARVLAMGGAHIAIADDDATLFMNPAGLAGARSLDLLNLEIETNLETIKTGQTIFDSLGSSGGDNAGAASDIFDSAFGKNVGIGFRLFPNVIVGGFGFGFLLDVGLPAGVANPVLTEIRADPTIQAGPALGYAHSFLDETLRVGLGLKAITRMEGNINLRFNRLLGIPFAAEEDREDFLTLTGEDGLPKNVYPALKGGMIATVDAGAIYNLPHTMGPAVEKWNPGFGLTVRDIPVFEQSFSQFAEQASVKLESEDAPAIPTSLAVGAAVTPWLVPWDEESTASRFIRAKIGLDVEDVLFATTDDGDLLKRVHFGSEFQFGPFFKQRKRLFRSDTKQKEVPFFSLEGGLNQVYYTAGFNLNIWKFLQIGAAWYAEELGAAAGDKGDRRLLVKIAL